MSKSGFEVRTARSADLPQVAQLAGLMVRLHHEWDRQRFAILHEPIEPGYENWLGRELQNKKALVLVAASNHTKGKAKILGYAYARLEGRDWNRLMDSCGFLHDLVVAEKARRRGVASALLESVIAWMAEHHAPRIILESAAANHVAQDFFRKRGFRATMIEMSREIE